MKTIQNDKRAEDMSAHTLHLDFETYSTLDLRKVGVENYVRAPGFTVTAVAWAYDNERPYCNTWPDTSLTDAMRQAIADGWTIRAWNASFEWHVLTYHFGLDVPFEQISCTMQRALAFGLPAALGDAGEALALPITKDASARRLMLTMGKPKKDGTAWHHDPSPKAQQMLKDLGQYCMQDVLAERAIDKVIPPLHKFERKLSLIDAEINQKGVGVDLDAVLALGVAVGFQRQRIDAECANLTGGAVTSPGTQTAKLLEWVALGTHNAVLPDLTKESVAHALSGWLPGPVRRVLELRQEAAKASTAKLERMLGWASSHDGRVRNALQFYGAGRTGRWAGRGIQVQNLPRKPKDFDASSAIAVAKAEPHALGLFHPRPLDAIKWSLRSCLWARDGYTLVSIDLSQIEARVLAWLAGQRDVLDAFARGEDVYTLAAHKVGSGDRQLGKVLTLACGFGMGHVKFRETAAAAPYFIDLSAAQAAQAVADWRDANPAITKLWHALAGAVLRSVGEPGVVFTAPGGIQIRTQGGVTQIRKPNSVKLTYHRMRIDRDDGGLVFDGVDSTTKQWGKLRTYGGKLVENVVQSVARDVLAEALLRIDVRPIATVHDEIVWERPEGENAKLFAAMAKMLMDKTPSWAPGLPIGSEVKISRRYGG